MGIKFERGRLEILKERGRLQNPEVETEKLSIAKIMCHIWYSPVFLLLFIADLLRLFISTVVGSVSAEFVIVYSTAYRSFSGETKKPSSKYIYYVMHCLSWQYSAANPSLFSLVYIHDAQIGVRPLDHCIAIGVSMKPHTSGKDVHPWAVSVVHTILWFPGSTAAQLPGVPMLHYAGAILSPKESRCHHLKPTQ